MAITMYKDTMRPSLSFQMFFMTWLSVMVTKYLSIYHGPLIAEINEETVMKYLKPFLISSALASAVIEFTFISDITNFGSFQQKYLGYAKQNSQIGRNVAIMVAINFAFFVILHVCMERDAFESDDIPGGIMTRDVVE